MVRRPVALALSLAALALAAVTALGVARRPGPALAVGDAFPAGVAPAAAARGVVLAWVFRSEDYLTCAAPAAELRRVQRALGAVRVVAVAVGDEHREWLPAFFRRERVDVDAAYLDLPVYRDRFGGSPLPALYLLRDGRVHRIIFAGDAQMRAPRRLKAIEPLVRAALAGPALDGEVEGS